ncbi:hypothetical protein NEFER03_1857 [Nematocida sp. LUAm3]|nr:hypothetical protein NEFER03_1857 [Nematocida sp. LUAm3]KAI5173993.1 hypothetical protein NEFER02_0460 [Nematocida sp. LUAm2]KAI5177263.1 hypothetical protein NEFER01_0538 [Nematocida sp. LUAm1]
MVERRRGINIYPIKGDEVMIDEQATETYQKRPESIYMLFLKGILTGVYVLSTIYYVAIIATHLSSRIVPTTALYNGKYIVIHIEEHSIVGVLVLALLGWMVLLFTTHRKFIKCILLRCLRCHPKAEEIYRLFIPNINTIRIYDDSVWCWVYYKSILEYFDNIDISYYMGCLLPPIVIIIFGDKLTKVLNVGTCYILLFLAMQLFYIRYQRNNKVKFHMIFRTSNIIYAWLTNKVGEYICFVGNVHMGCALAYYIWGVYNMIIERNDVWTSSFLFFYLIWSCSIYYISEVYAGILYTEEITRNPEDLPPLRLLLRINKKKLLALPRMTIAGPAFLIEFFFFSIGQMYNIVMNNTERLTIEAPTPRNIPKTYLDIENKNIEYIMYGQYNRQETTGERMRTTYWVVSKTLSTGNMIWMGSCTSLCAAVVWVGYAGFMYLGSVIVYDPIDRHLNSIKHVRKGEVNISFSKYMDIFPYYEIFFYMGLFILVVGALSFAYCAMLLSSYRTLFLLQDKNIFDKNKTANGYWNAISDEMVNVLYERTEISDHSNSVNQDLLENNSFISDIAHL